MSPKNGSVILFLSSDKILLFHRDNIPTIRSPDCWSLIGGGIEDMETPEQCLIREVTEEACFELTNFQFLTQTKGTIGETIWIYVSFVDKADENKFHHGPGEGQEIGWFTLDEALNLKLTPGVKTLLTTYRELIETAMITRLVPDIKSLKLNPPITK